jgi:adsorption protein B
MPAWLDSWIAAAAIPLAIWLLVSGLDDLFVTLVWLVRRLPKVTWPSDAQLESVPERPIAILLPLWHEDRVIGQMLERNLASIAYRNYDVFAGVYPNDEPTARAVSEVAGRHARVHLAVVPHDGPTSKADCLNAAWRRMKAFESSQGTPFQVIVVHDAEDQIDRRSLRLINWFSRDYEMVQVPVLPLRTPSLEFTHGLYCDEFTEFQLKDLAVRQGLGGFLPSCGVGTGFAREALERLAATRQGVLFDPECLTEDYETGFRLHALGCRQVFLGIHFDGRVPMATREYFPRTFRAATRQRSRWVAGVALQGWERHGWRVPWRQAYWLWRDRKGLVGSLIGPVANLLFLYGLSSALVSSLRHAPWALAAATPAWVARCYMATGACALTQVTTRMYATARVYGPRFAWAAPLRTLWGTLINCVATAESLRQFLHARVQRGAMAWRKTEHAYPAHFAPDQRLRLGEVLVNMQWAAPVEIEEALPRVPPGLRLGEYLIQSRMLSEERLYRALSLQTGIPEGMPLHVEVDRLTTRVLPAEAVRRWKVLPYRVEMGRLHVVTAEVPTEATDRELAGFSALEIRYRLVRPGEFERMAGEYLPPAGT